MKEQIENVIIERARNWIDRRNKRTDEEIEAYLQAVQDVLMAIYEDTSQGAYPAHHIYDVLEEQVFYPDDSNIPDDFGTHQFTDIG